MEIFDRGFSADSLKGFSENTLTSRAIGRPNNIHFPLKSAITLSYFRRPFSTSFRRIQAVLHVFELRSPPLSSRITRLFTQETCRGFRQHSIGPPFHLNTLRPRGRPVAVPPSKGRRLNAIG